MGYDLNLDCICPKTLSVQESTRFSPYHLLHACAPVVPPAQMERHATPLGLDDPELALNLDGP